MSNPRKAEAKGEDSASFKFHGETFTVPLEFDDYPLDYIEAASDGKPLVVQARALLGPEQWAKVQAMNLTGRGLFELEKAINESVGVTEGESEASSD